MRILFVMDPAAQMIPDKDTSFAFMRAAQNLGHECFHALVESVGTKANSVIARSRPIRVSEDAPHVTLGEESSTLVEAFDAVFIRKDPPFDSAYLHLTQILELVARKTLVVNDPRGLRDANEKLFALHFTEFMPQTFVTSSPKEILDFVKVVGESILKPLDGAGGSGVVKLFPGNKNNKALADLLTQEGRRLAMVQQFLPAIEHGDKRVLVLEGKPLGAIRRVPMDDDIRANIHVGGRVEATTLSERETKLVEAIGPTLVAYGLYFVGLDLIDEHLIEVNVTSPTGIQELGRLTGTRPEEAVIKWAEQRAFDLRGKRA
jgi:glutathione synthase